MIVHPSAIVVTCYVVEWADDRTDRQDWLADCLVRHNSRDWGDLDPDDADTNDDTLARHAGRLFSRYLVPDALADGSEPDDAMWIITDDVTDPDSATTILWPSEY